MITNRKKVLYLSLGIGLMMVGYALWIPAKAELAQAFLEIAWKKTIKSGGMHRPWPWADHYPVAKLKSNKHNIEQIILAGDSGAVMAFAPGENLEAKNIPDGSRIISAHRDTHFRFLEHTEIGDEISLIDKDGESTYQVIGHQVVDSRDHFLAPERNPNGLILVTCFPFNAIQAGGPLRFVVTLEPKFT